MNDIDSFIHTINGGDFPTLSDLRELGMKFIQINRVSELKDLIYSYGVQSLSHLPAAKYADFYRRLNQLMSP